ncbi:hypothetical protein RJ639_035208 [Escallonia herrerae]|uniref:Bet v I/Major latex protein domain-containing protein n=1 Tax=Escallonia herrerae TaxID=1293975 RepID=A0AA88WVP6_9ASTE|nr:hypothetical protein RJ639_035208 [Escallonia herrerae]
MAAEGLPDTIEKIEVIKGDEGVGTIDVNVPASKAWEFYGTLELATVVGEGLPDTFEKIEVIKGDGGVGTILEITLSLGALAFFEQYTTVDHAKRVKVVEVVEGGFLNLGFNLLRFRFDIAEKGENSCITKGTVEYDLKEEAATNASSVAKIDASFLLNIMKVVAKHMTTTDT